MLKQLQRKLRWAGIWMEKFLLLLVHIRMYKRNDEPCLPQGTAYVTDVGMVGPRDGCLGWNGSCAAKVYNPACRFVS